MATSHNSRHSKNTSSKKDALQTQEIKANFSESEESLIDFFKRSPCQDFDLDISRDKEPVRDIDLSTKTSSIQGLK